METRKESERSFFDAVHGSTTVRPTALNLFYGRAQGGARFSQAILDGCKDKDVLEDGCGAGGYAYDLAAEGARVTGIDIAPAAVARARQKALETPSLSLQFEVADAENLAFPDAAFDRVCGSGILHHLDIRRAVQQIGRVLRPGGDAIFLEPVAYNPISAAFRVLTPKQHTPDEHPLVRSDLDLFHEAFDDVRMEFYSLTSPAVIPLLVVPGGGGLFRVAEAIDRALLRVPGLRWLGSFSVIFLSRPKR